MKNTLKKVALILFAVTLATCRKSVNTESFVNEDDNVSSTRAVSTLQATRTIGDVTRHFDLYIPTLITNVRGWEQQYGYFGLWMPSSRRLYLIDGQWQVGYNCPIGNDAPQVPNGQNDFIIDKSVDGIVDITCIGCYTFAGITEVTVFKLDANGYATQTSTFQKQQYDLESTDFIDTYDYNIHQYYAWDTMFIQAKTFDRYYNYAPIPGTLTPDPGNYIVVVQVDPDQLTADYNKSNNVTSLPLTIDAGMGVNSIPILNTNLLSSMKLKPVTNLTGVYQAKNIKKVFLDWDCPYHLPLYIRHWFTVYKNGVLLADNLTNSDFIDNVPASFKTANYTVFINVPGFSKSIGVNKTINK